MRHPRPVLAGARRGLVVVLAAVLLAGCEFDGAGSLPLPLREGVGEGSYQVTVELEQVANLVPNAEVKVNDVTVGVVERTDVENWNAVLTVGLNPETVLPANAEARIGQKSLLGAQYLELTPPTDEPPQGRLSDGDLVPLERTGRYPETEEVLAALSVVLNGGGLQQVRTITVELNNVLDGREGDLRALIENLNTFVGTIDDQRGDIVRAIDGLNRLAGNIERDNDVLAEGLETIPPALRVLNEDRDALVDTLVRVGAFGDVAVRVIDGARDDLLTNLRQLRPALARLADSESDLTESLTTVLTFPFPSSTSFPRFLAGDYANLFATFDLSPAVLVRNFLGGFDMPGAPSLLTVPPLGAGQEVLPPFAPFLDSAGPLPPGLVPVPPPGGGAPALPVPEAPAAPPASGGILGGLLGGS